MNTSRMEMGPSKPKSWSDIVGPVYHFSDLPSAIISDKGLIALDTTKGRHVCPIFQFEQDEDGQLDLNADISLAWQLLTAMQIEKLGESKWTAVARLSSPRDEFDGASWADVLKNTDEESRESKLRVYSEIINDAITAAKWQGIDLQTYATWGSPAH